jgi:hypothetical protein
MNLSKSTLRPSIDSVAKNVALSIFFLFSLNLFAQDFELIKIQSAYYPKQKLEDASVDGEIGFFEWGTQVAIPQTFKKNKKTILIHKIIYANLTANTEVNFPLFDSKTTRYYHTIIYDLGLVQTMNTNWLLVANFIPTLASDFEEKLSGNDLLFQANALAVNTKKEKLKYGFGLAYTTRLGRQLVIPVGLLKYKTQKFELDMVLPNKLSAMIKTKMNKTNKNIFSFGLKAGLNGGVFNNTSELQIVSNSVDVVGYSRLTIGPAITIRLKDAININLEGGMTLNRRWELIDSNNVIFDRTPQSSSFLGFGFSFAPKVNNNNQNFNF